MSSSRVLATRLGRRSLHKLYARPFSVAAPSLERQVHTLDMDRRNDSPWKTRARIPASLAGRLFSNTTWTASGGDQQLTRVEVDTPELAELVQKGDVQLIDVREPWEVEETGSLAPNSINIPLGEVEEALQVTPEFFRQSYKTRQPQKHQSLIFYCMAGVRSLAALETAQDLGYTNARHYIRGWLGWQVHLDTLKTQQ